MSCSPYSLLNIFLAILGNFFFHIHLIFFGRSIFNLLLVFFMLSLESGCVNISILNQYRTHFGNKIHFVYWLGN